MLGLSEENSAPGESQMTSFRAIVKQVLPSSIIEKMRDIRHSDKELSIAKNYTEFFAGKSGIEIGGPSSIFRNHIPIYRCLNRLDGVNFAATTIWEGSIEDKKAYRYYAEKPGTQHILEASDLSTLNDQSYDFLISSNCLEHMANPLKALTEWTRVIRKDGYILLALPKKEDNFDHRRNVTPFDHLVEDFMINTTEHDLTHIDEIISLHDLSMDPPAGDLAHFKARSEKNFENRCLHHHVFDADIIQRMFKFVGVSLVREDIALGNYIAIGIK